MEKKPYSLKRSFIPAIILYSPIFSPLKNSLVRKNVFFQCRRTYQESITYDGYQLDSDLDFKLYSCILSKLHSKDKLNLVFSRDELFDALDITSGRHRNKFESLFLRIERFKECELTPEYNVNGLKQKNSNSIVKERVGFNLIDDVVMSEDKYSITVTVNNRMINFFNNSSREWVNIDVFSRIKTQRCKAMYLMILTLKFPKEKSFRISVEDIENRLCANIEVMESKISSKELKSQSNRIIRNTLKELVRLQIVSGFDFKLKSSSILFIKSNSLPYDLLINP